MSKGTKGKGMVVLGLDLGPNCILGPKRVRLGGLMVKATGLWPGTAGYRD